MPYSIGSSSRSSGESLRGERGLCLSQTSGEMVSSEITPEQTLAQCISRVQELTESEQVGQSCSTFAICLSSIELQFLSFFGSFFPTN